MRVFDFEDDLIEPCCLNSTAAAAVVQAKVSDARHQIDRYESAQGCSCGSSRSIVDESHAWDKALT